MPPPELLGNARQPARRDRLQTWLESHREGAQGLILSLDTWIYGNLVASRKNREELQVLQERVHLLQSFRNHGLAIHGFATLLRLSNSNDDTEERPYWARHGQQIYRFSWLEHYLAMSQASSSPSDPHPDSSVLTELNAEYAALKVIIPSEVLADYQSLRTRNFAVLENLLQTAEQDVLQTLLIGCDDGGSHGWTVVERSLLQGRIESSGLSKKALLYPGADDLASTLVARVLEPRQAKISIAWTYPATREGITRYEGLPLNQTLAHQARAAGIELVDEADAADGLLWIHNPPGEQIDQFLDRESRVKHPEERFEPLLEALKRGELPVALADVCYANGGDIQLLNRLEEEKLLFRLQGYAGWNTAGNTLGMLLAWFKLSLLQLREVQMQQRFLIERLADDGWYQGYLRQQLCSHYTEPVSIHSCIQAIAFYNDKFRDWLEWMPNAPPLLQIQHLSFPWQRFFEIDLRVCLEESQNTHCPR